MRERERERARERERERERERRERTEGPAQSTHSMRREGERDGSGGRTEGLAQSAAISMGFADPDLRRRSDRRPRLSYAPGGGSGTEGRAREREREIEAQREEREREREQESERERHRETD